MAMGEQAGYVSTLLRQLNLGQREFVVSIPSQYVLYLTETKYEA